MSEPGQGDMARPVPGNTTRSGEGDMSGPSCIREPGCYNGSSGPGRMVLGANSCHRMPGSFGGMYLPTSGGEYGVRGSANGIRMPMMTPRTVAPQGHFVEQMAQVTSAGMLVDNASEESKKGSYSAANIPPLGVQEMMQLANPGILREPPAMEHMPVPRGMDPHGTSHAYRIRDPRMVSSSSGPGGMFSGANFCHTMPGSIGGMYLPMGAEELGSRSSATGIRMPIMMLPTGAPQGHFVEQMAQVTSAGTLVDIASEESKGGSYSAANTPPLLVQEMMQLANPGILREPPAMEHMPDDLYANMDRKYAHLAKEIQQFKEMLAQKEVSGSSTWEKECHLFESDRRYRQLRTQPELRQIIFDNFVKDRAELERKSEDFRALLEEAGLTASSSYREFMNKFGEEMRCKSLDGWPVQRFILFKEFIFEIHDKEEEVELLELNEFILEMRRKVEECREDRREEVPVGTLNNIRRMARSGGIWPPPSEKNCKVSKKSMGTGKGRGRGSKKKTEEESAKEQPEHPEEEEEFS